MPSFRPATVVQPAHVVTFLSLLAFLCCLAAEFKRARVRDLKLDGNLCSLPGTPAFGLGVAAIVCLFVAQVLGTSVSATTGSILCITAWRRSHGTAAAAAADAKKKIVPIALLVFSWIIFGILLILLGTTSSMNNRQPYGIGWMDGECYVVRRGVYLGSAMLVSLMVMSILGYMFTTRDALAGGSHPDKLGKEEAS